VYSEKELLAFEEEVAQEFATGSIHAPIHLGGGNEKQLIDLFKTIAPEDWVLCGWRSHYHCLLKGVPPKELREAIRAGRSVSLCFPKQKILSSGIVGGTAPIAVGLAWALKQKQDIDYTGNESFVYCFIGDMTAESGIVHEAMQYAARHKLPVRWIVEDNGLSVCTDTQQSWGMGNASPDVRHYKYKLSRPHAGIGKWVRF